MSAPISPLHTAIHAKFRVAFGEPSRIIDHNLNWSLRTLSYISAVNVLSDGSAQSPVVWVFDPHDPSNGVSSTIIKHESEIDPLIEKIVQRVKRAGQPLPR